ncbi:LytTR family transcriptional regulator [Rhodobacteraceae bacterium CCMM004]|nr:LytTR family transcriptional regulator [Rhodobacteraceae bacterium CCMM004]
MEKLGHGRDLSWQGVAICATLLPGPAGRRHAGSVTDMQNRANDTAAQSALRELRRDFASPKSLVAMAGLSVILAFVGPFGTDALLGFAPRLIYWAVLVVGCYGAGALIGPILGPRLPRSWPWTLRLTAVGLVIGVAACAVVLAVNLTVFRWWPEPAELAELAAAILPIAVVVSFMLDILLPAPAAAPAPLPPPLLDRLPVAKRGPLLALTAEDHYTRVRTAAGEELVLLRLSDAMREVGDTPGAQVHRSHWVAWDAVRAARREGDRAVLSLSHGGDIPVSRTYVPTIKDAGLLPK